MKVGQHCQKVHRNENEMMRIAAMSTGTVEGKKGKQLELEILWFKGGFEHNIKALTVGGEVKVWKWPNEEGANYQMFKPCTYCPAFV